LLFFLATQLIYSQEDDGVVGLELPMRNSLTFNRFVLNPTFSFVREQNKYITLYNKSEMLQVEDAPQTYFASFSGRLQENIGVGIGFFQQNYGVLTSFGGIVNFAYNAALARESNLTLGLNVGAYKSGVNSGKVVTNFPDPSLDNIPSNFLLTVSPGINYGSGFMDFGVSVNNLVAYNFNTSKLIEENPKQGIQGHIMYTGYLGGYGFFEDSKFSALGRAEFRKDNSIFSGNMMLTVPKGFWIQGGYNTLYGATGGIGLNITTQIAIEYNYEKALGGLADFGSSHEITLAFKFKNNNYFEVGNDDEIAGLISFEKKRKPTNNKPKVATQTPEPTPEPEELPELENIGKSEAQIKFEADKLAKSEEQANEKTETDALAKAQEQARLKAEADALAKAEEQARLKAEAEALAKAEEQARLKAEADALAKAEEEARLKAEADALAKAEEEARLKAEADALAKAEEEVRLKAEADALAKAEEEARLKAEADALAVAEPETEAISEEKEEENIKPTDDIGQTIQSIVEESQDSKQEQIQLINQLTSAVAIKDTDLKDLKRENDLSEQGVFVAPKPFKSISEENNAIEMLLINLDEVVITQRKKINRLEALLQERVQLVNDPDDEINKYYAQAIAELKAKQEETVRSRETLVSSLEAITIATEFERKRRIKRAGFNNEQDRLRQDMARLSVLKETTERSSTPLNVSDFDFGEDRSNNIQILKNVENTENGYYLILAVHSDTEKRDDFVRKVIASGNDNVNYFYNVNTSKYYIYQTKVDSINEANDALKTKGSEPYTEKLSIIKIEN
tara:strand:+ start:99710 stop:102106 length:2397 start_codon:yes stop_codon:yes gene_type:complete